MLALSAGVYSTYYVVRDEQISEEDVVGVVENIELPKALEETQEIPLLTSSISGTSSGVDIINSESSDEGNHLVTNDSVESISDDTERVIISLGNVSDNQTDSALPETKKPKDSASEITNESNNSLPEPSSDLETISGGIKRGNPESLDPPSVPISKKEEVKHEASSGSPDAKLPSEKSESNGPNAVPETINKIEKPISIQPSHSVNTVAISDQISQTTDLHVEQVQDIQIEVGSSASVSALSKENVIVVEEEEFDINEVMMAIDLGKSLSWGSSDAVSRQDLIHENSVANEGRPKSELPTKSDEQEEGGLSSWIPWLNPFGR